jgi:hypothetical protein
LVNAGRETQAIASGNTVIILTSDIVIDGSVEARTRDSSSYCRTIGSGDGYVVEVGYNLIVVEGLVIGNCGGLCSKESWVVKESQDVGEVAVPFIVKEPEVSRVSWNFGWDDRTYITDKVITRGTKREALKEWDQGARDAKTAEIESALEFIK